MGLGEGGEAAWCCFIVGFAGGRGCGRDGEAVAVGEEGWVVEAREAEGDEFEGADEEGEAFGWWGEVVEEVAGLVGCHGWDDVWSG